MCLRHRWSIPQPLAVPYLSHLRERSSATITTRKLPDHRRELRIVHAPLLGVTRPMLEWWMRHVDEHTEWNGHRIPAYRLWHPRDHIHIAIKRLPDGIVGAGWLLATSWNSHKGSF